MPQDKIIAARVSDELKTAFRHAAQARGMTNSALLVAMMKAIINDQPAIPTAPPPEEPANTRLTLRLRPGDRTLLNARSAARNMRPSSYCVMLLRAHLLGTAPLPTDELHTLKATLGHVSAIGRNLNQVTHRLHLNNDAARDDQLPHHLQEVRQIVDTLRHQIADLIRANLQSWEASSA